MRSKSTPRSAFEGRSHTSFDALLEASGKVDQAASAAVDAGDLCQRQQSSLSHPSRQSAYSRDGAALSLESAEEASAACPGEDRTLDAAVQESLPEGVGTSGGGESGDTGASTDPKRDSQGLADFPNEESSEVHMGHESFGGRASRHHHKRQRMVWTGELHQRFLNAVNHLGMKNAVPKTILRMMNVEGMTRENVASHLQKYRLHVRRQAGGGGSRAASPDDGAGLVEAGGSSTGFAQGMPVGGFSVTAAPAPYTGDLAIGVPVSSAYMPSAFPPATSHIPPQAWAAGVPGYDALQALQSLGRQGAVTSAAAAASAGLPAAFAPPHTAAAQVPGPPPAGLVSAPALDIAPLVTTPPPPPAIG